MKTKIVFWAKKTVLAILISFFCHWAWSLAVCEWRTFWNWKEFYGLDELTQMLSASPTVKVLEYSNDEARVYYRSYQGGTVIRFHKVDNRWELVDWGIGWSRTGTADDWIWPYGR